MNVRLVIDSSNAAFDEDPFGEVKRILHKAAEKFESNGPGKITLTDINGNTVGFAELSLD